MHLLRHIELLPCFRRQVAYLNSDLSVGLTILTAILGNLRIAVKLAHSKVQSFQLAVAKNSQCDLGTRRHLADRDL